MVEREYLLWLSRIEGLGRKKQGYLLDYFKSAEAIFFASHETLAGIKKLTKNNINNIIESQSERLLEKHLLELERLKINFSAIVDEDYPKLLKDIFDPPLVLYYKGILPPENLTKISVVGSRLCTEYGKTTSFKICKELSRENIVIVSGMARGIDTMAHRGALDGGTYTIAVVGCGVDVCYPPENRGLMSRIIENGCIMSEYPPRTKPLPGHFPMRNRIISGLSTGVVVIESAEKSGTLITVDNALEQGKIVFAVPGNITSKFSKGTNTLIKQGAILTDSYADVLKELNIVKNNEVKQKKTKETDENLTHDEAAVYSVISQQPLTVDEIFIISNTDIKTLQYILTMLELKGYIMKLPGQKYIRSL